MTTTTFDQSPVAALGAVNYIRGRWTPSTSGEHYENRNPSDPSEVVSLVARSSTEDVRSAVEAAHDAWPAWASTPIAARAAFLDRAAAALEAHADDVANAMSREMGKPIRESRGEVSRASQILRFVASAAFSPIGESFEQSASTSMIATRRRPLGAVRLITPWNFPCAIPAWKAAPALIYGNTVVVKLAYEAPLSGLALAAAFASAEIPPGVLNVITGDGVTAGAALVSAPQIRAISFTGSVATGEHVREVAVSTGKRVQLELGGHNPLLVMEDADLERAVEASFMGAFASAGQKCTATRRIYVQESVFEKFRSRLLARTEQAVIGDPTDPSVEIGPLVNNSQYEAVLEAIDRGIREGGTILAGGEPDTSKPGFFIRPTIFGDVGDDAFLSCEEVFGPVTSLYRFDSFEEAIDRANSGAFGLSASIFTSNLKTAMRFENEMDAGMLHVNSQTAGADVHVPFGGVKASSFGPREQGRAAREFFTESITIYRDA